MVVAPQSPGPDGANRSATAAGRRARLAAAGRAGSISRSYSRMVGVLKYALPAIGLVIVALIVLWPELQHTQVDISDGAPRPAAAAGEIQNPRYSGVDEAARPYTVWATLAKQVQDEVFDLNRPKGEMKLPSGMVLNLDAQTGKLDRGAKSVHLSGNVTLRRSDGTTMVTDAADIDLADKGARSSMPVTAEGPFGTLSAGGFKVEQQGDVIIFTGPTKLLLKPGADKAFQGTPQ
ncbi:LPS export ABC transporter periplasmic protein LptC [Inquilinus limosus]|uniref:LPS export ABC transporter periplasmic protein LptC n=1 Tax=Inquilinus limosus TaxID=171674 RepID=UPI0003F55EE3|nr:LPS export ABC transporter periplasmic protein LptC [Inquilinus limosus]